MAPEGDTQQWWIAYQNTQACCCCVGSHTSGVLIRLDMLQHTRICHQWTSNKDWRAQDGMSVRKDMSYLCPDISVVQLFKKAADVFVVHLSYFTGTLSV